MEWLTEELGVPLGKLKDAYQHLRPLLDVDQIGNEEFWRRFLLEAGSKLDPGLTEHYWSDNYVADNPLIAGMLSLVDRLKRAGFKVGLLSNIDREHAEINKTRHIFEHFDAVLLSDEIKERKPQPEVYELLADSLGVKLNELIFVDDLPENAAAARRLGAYGISFTGRRDLINELESLGLKF